MLTIHKPKTLAFDDRYEIRINFFLPAENNYIFNEADFFRLHAGSPNDLYAQLVRTSDERVYATIAFYEVADRVFVSPKNGTFGGLGLNNALDMQLTEQFLYTLLDHLKAAGARTIDLKCAPFCHDLALSSVVSNILLRHGGTLTAHELNYDMRITDRPFLERVDYGNVKRIRKCVREGFIAEKLDASRYEMAYQVIRDNRDRRGYPMSMTIGQLNTIVKTFPNRVHVFAVYPDAQRIEMAAASVCIEISHSTLYVFYWGDATDMEAYSPVSLMACCIYEFCQGKGFKLLDAGTSTVAGIPNYGLIRFKRNLGFSESLKPSFSLSAQIS